MLVSFTDDFVRYTVSIISFGHHSPNTTYTKHNITLRWDYVQLNPYIIRGAITSTCFTVTNIMKEDPIIIISHLQSEATPHHITVSSVLTNRPWPISQKGLAPAVWYETPGTAASRQFLERVPQGPGRIHYDCKTRILMFIDVSV